MFSFSQQNITSNIFHKSSCLPVSQKLKIKVEYGDKIENNLQYYLN